MYKYQIRVEFVLFSKSERQADKKANRNDKHFSNNYVGKCKKKIAVKRTFLRLAPNSLLVMPNILNQIKSTLENNN